ncbi:MAG TPA: serine/threonine-protein kinase [Polyangiaceae bacterium]|nr:serine/threonine-protein kinase [Polyangiaceae bacterium]
MNERFAPGQVLAGKLRIVRLLGAGGMGAVFEVEHELTRHRRALKLLHPQMAGIPSVVERFLREASAAGRIGNRHIVETFDAGRLETGEPYIVMELLTGRTLGEVLEQRGPLSLDAACDIVIQACDAVSAAHAAGIVHRDLKPENLFLCGSDASFVKILDFGVSKFDSATTGVDGITLEGSPIGTPFYMSPEQVRGEKNIDARADVYALGVLFYECLTGRKPFVAETLPHLAVLIYQGKYATPSEVRNGLPPAVDLVVSRAMASDRTERFASADELSSAVSRLRSSLAPGFMGQTQPLVQSEPPIAPPRPMPALTPAVFTSPPSDVVKPRSRLWIPLAVVALAGLGVVGAQYARTRSEAASSAEPPSVNVPTHTAVVPVVNEDAAPRVEPSASPLASASPSAAAPVHGKGAVSVVPIAPSAAAAASAVAAPSAQPVGSVTTPRSRASSYGLSQENPFK